jgi:hypothetical protein
LRGSEIGYPADVRENGSELTMRAMFLIWICLIVAGIAYYSVVGLSHG